jgi:hypothetical protein
MTDRLIYDDSNHIMNVYIPIPKRPCAMQCYLSDPYSHVYIILLRECLILPNSGLSLFSLLLRSRSSLLLLIPSLNLLLLNSPLIRPLLLRLLRRLNTQRPSNHPLGNSIRLLRSSIPLRPSLACGIYAVAVGTAEGLSAVGRRDRCWRWCGGVVY